MHQIPPASGQTNQRDADRTKDRDRNERGGAETGAATQVGIGGTITSGDKKTEEEEMPTPCGRRTDCYWDTAQKDLAPAVRRRTPRGRGASTAGLEAAALRTIEAFEAQAVVSTLHIIMAKNLLPPWDRTRVPCIECAWYYLLLIYHNLKTRF